MLYPSAMAEKDVFDKLFDQAPQKLETVKQVSKLDGTVNNIFICYTKTVGHEYTRLYYDSMISSYQNMYIFS